MHGDGSPLINWRATTEKLRSVPFLLLLGCQAPEALLSLEAQPSTCRHEPVSAVRVTLLGDFAPTVVSDGVSPEVPPRRLGLGLARSVAVEGLSARGVVALGWSGPLPAPQPGETLPVPVLYGAPDSLCQVWGLRIPRAFHRATLVAPGRVLVTGGVTPEGPADSMEPYWPGSPEGQRTMPLYEGAAIGHSATAIGEGQGGGRVLIAGGARPGPAAADNARQRARLYNERGEPEEGVLLLEGGPRALHAAVRLPRAATATVFLSGGCARLDPLPAGKAPTCPAASVLDTTVRWDEQLGFVPGPSLLRPRFGHESFALADGRVLLVGGTTVDPATKKLTPALDTEVLDPGAAPGARPGVAAGRAGTPAALLPTESVLWAAPTTADPTGVLVPGEGEAKVAPAVPRLGATLSVLPDGAALLVGGREGVNGDGAVVSAVELYEGGAFRTLPDALPRVGHAALPLPDGTVLLVGGLTEAGATSPLVSRFIHSLRVPDATPPPWPVAAAELGWIGARRPDRARFDGAELVVEAPAAAPRPELALLSGVRWAGGELRVTATLRLGAPDGGGAAVVLGHEGDRRFVFLRLAPGQPLGLWRVTGGIAPDPGCVGAPVSIAELAEGAALTLRLRGGELSVRVGAQERLRCRPELPERGALGLGSLGGQAAFRALSLSRVLSDE